MINFSRTNKTRLFLLAMVSLSLAIWIWSSAQAEEGDIQLPEGYVSDQIYSPTLAGLSGLVASHNGTVYVRHLGPGAEVRVSRLNVDQGTLTRILTLPPWASAQAVVGGPDGSFFIQVGSEIRQVQPDGSYTVWTSFAPPGLPELYTEDGRMLGIGQAGTAVIEMFADGSTGTLLSNLSGVYDVIADDNGNIYISDFPAGELIHLNDSGISRTVTTIAKDNTDLAIDQLGNLYINNAASGFARVNLATGEKTAMTAPSAVCPALQSPALVLFDDSDRAIFGSWVANAITWADFSSGDGRRLVHQPWANTPAADILLNTPEGLYRIWIPSAGERVQLVIDLVDQFVLYESLNRGQGKALTAKLQAIAAALERGRLTAAYNQTIALLSHLRAFTYAGILDESEADLLFQAVQTHILGSI